MVGISHQGRVKTLLGCGVYYIGNKIFKARFGTSPQHLFYTLKSWDVHKTHQVSRHPRVGKAVQGKHVHRDSQHT